MKAARFLQIEGVKDFDNSSLIMSSGNSMSSRDGQASITAYLAEECPPPELMRPLAWLAAQNSTGHESPLDSMPNSPSSFQSSDSFESATNNLSGKPTVIVNGATGEFTTFYQQMSPINLKLSAPSADNKQELKRKLLQKKRQLISNGSLDVSRPKKSCLDVEMRLNVARAGDSNRAPSATKRSHDLQVTLQPSGQSIEPLMLINGNKYEAMKSDDFEDEETNHSLKIAVDDNSKDGAEGQSEDESNGYVAGDSNNNHKSHEVKDNVVIVNQNSSKCLLLKIKSGKIYKDDPHKGKLCSQIVRHQTILRSPFHTQTSTARECH